jgi:peptide/nickel transport system permease protein
MAQLQGLKRILRRYPGLVFGCFILLVFITVSLLAPFLTPHDPLMVDLGHRLLPPSWMVGGDKAHLLGTDMLGRDIFSLLIYGARVSFFVALLILAITSTLGTTLGIVSGYLGGIVDTIIMRLVDLTFSLPVILFALAVGTIFGPGILPLTIILSLLLWSGYARMARGEVLRIKESDFIAYAKVTVASQARIMQRHLLPNILTPIVVLVTLSMSRLIILLSTLSFLGVGIPPSTPDWGNMISNGRTYLNTAWWISIFPCLAIAVAVLSFNMLGDTLNEYLNPELRFRTR